VRVILAASGQQLGVMKIQDALRAAQQAGLDLVEVAPTAVPPVCRIVDFGKFKYELAKHEKDKKHATSKLKEIKFRVNISSHDYETKLRHAEEFLDKNNKVRVQLQFRGRENAHKELGMVLMKKISEDLLLMANVEQPPKLMGRAITMTLAPLPAGKRKRRFANVDVLPEDVFDEEDLVGNVARNTAKFRKTLEKLYDLPIVGNVRGDGYFFAIELVKDKATKQTFTPAECEKLLRGYLAGAMLKVGLYARADDRGNPVIQLAPPLTIGPKEFDELEQMLRKVLTPAMSKI
jgi:translation initiation factor IF-3